MIKRDTVFLMLILIFVFFNLFLPFPHIASDLHLSFKDQLLSQFSIPSAWTSSGSSGLGQSASLLLWNWPITFLFGAFGKLGMSHQFLLKIFGFLPIILLGIFSLNKFFEKIKISENSKLVAKVFYMTTTYFLLLVDGGQLSIALCYAWFPFCYIKFIECVDGNISDKIVAALSITILGFLDIRFIYVLLILIFLHFIFNLVFLSFKEWSSHIGKWFNAIFAIGIIGITINFYWILPIILSRSTDASLLNIRESQTHFLNFTQFKNAISLLQPHWYRNIFGVISAFKKEFLFIPLLAFMSLFMYRKNKRVWFWTLIAIISVFLTKGDNPPFSGIYPWLFTHIPGFFLFRDSTKFFFLVSLSYAVLISYTVDSLIKRLPKIKIIFPVLLILFFLFLTRPIFLGQMTGIFSKPSYTDEYLSLGNKLEKDTSFGRVLWLPLKAPMGFASLTHSGIEANRLESIRPFAIGTVGAYETQNFIREADYMGELFSIAGIKYITYPYLDPKRDDMLKEKVDYYGTFSNQIKSLLWVGDTVSDFPISVFKTKENEGKIFLSKNTYYVVGSDRLYSDIVKLGAKFKDNALVFVEEGKNLINKIVETPGANIIVYDKNLTDLALSFTQTSNFISPSSILGFSPGKTGWWKREAIDLVWTRDFLQQKYGIDNLDFDYGEGWAIAEGDRELTITNNQFTKGKILYARVMESSRGGNIEFWQGNNKLGEVNTKIETPEKVVIKLTGNVTLPDKFYRYDKANFHWVKIGELLNNSNLTINTKGDINILNTLAVISKEQENNIFQSVDKLVNDKKIVEWDSLTISDKKKLLFGADTPIVSYTTLSQTHYKIKVEGLKNPTTLFFSETFDSNWELNNQKGYKLYSFINGFWIDHNGEYDLYFSPQKYVLPGLIVSMITLASCIMFLIWKRSKKSS
ncbi:MAG TPA: hypothetical protein VFI61_01500 [Patescibacteria group bacterium]|nr:hypothetical protein [Patescibacteria group bacterium]